MTLSKAMQSQHSSLEAAAINYIATAQAKQSVKIPTEANAALKAIGGFAHPRNMDKTGKHKAQVTVWAPHQVAIWNDPAQCVLVHKSNRGGVSMCGMLLDTTELLQPRWASGRCLLMAPTQRLANALVLELKRLLITSNYRKYLIKQPEKFLFKEEKSNMATAVIVNPYNPLLPSKITGIGFSESLAYSWPDVVRVHITDPAEVKAVDQTSFFNALYGRIANSQGRILMEGVPGHRRYGHFWDIAKTKFNLEGINPDQQEADIIDLEQGIEKESEKIMAWSCHQYDIDDYVKYGLITKEMRASFESGMPTDEYERLFKCKWPQYGGKAFGEFARPPPDTEVLDI